MLVVSRVLRRSRTLAIGSCQAACAKFSNAVESQGDIFEVPAVVYERRKPFPRFYHSVSVGQRMMSSKGYAKSTEEEEEEEDYIEGGLSELEAANSAQETSIQSDLGDELKSEDESVDPIKTEGKKAAGGLFKAITTAPGQSVSIALDKWCNEGKELTRAEISRTLLSLRRHRMLKKALQLSELLEANEKWEMNEKDYVYRLDLIARVRGLQKAEDYIEKIPEFVSRELVYRTFLANCVAVRDVMKSEEVFNKMKDSEFPITAFECNQMLVLYKKSDILSLMEEKKVKPNALTYLALIDAKGLANDITGMDRVVEMMKAEGVEPNLRTKVVLAEKYASAGFDEKAEKVLKELEGEKPTSIRGVCSRLLLVYAQLGKADEVDRIWKICSQNPKMADCMAAIEAYGRVNEIEKAEAVFERVMKLWKYATSRIYPVLLKVYAEHGMLSKGKDLIKTMDDRGCKIGPLTWEAIVKLYVQAGDVEKADSILSKSVQPNQSKVRPRLDSFLVVMDAYAERGDVRNAEKMFDLTRLCGYSAGIRQFQALVQAYANAKSPAYGMRNRIEAANVVPDESMSSLLAQVDPFKRTAVFQNLSIFWSERNSAF